LISCFIFGGTQALDLNRTYQTRGGGQGLNNQIYRIAFDILMKNLPTESQGLSCQLA